MPELREIPNTCGKSVYFPEISTCFQLKYFANKISCAPVAPPLPTVEYSYDDVLLSMFGNCDRTIFFETSRAAVSRVTSAW